jgi:UDP-glucose 4-epimerase
MRLLITGGAGCLGASIIDRWVTRGIEILVIDNFTTGNRESLPPRGRISVVEGSVCDQELIDETFLKFAPSHVIHAAASYKDPNDWRGDAMTNIIGTINVAEASLRTGIDRFIFLQTALCYGRPTVTPIPINHPLRPETSYATSKTMAEQYLQSTGLPWASLRLANVTGPRLAIGPIPTFYSRLQEGKPCFCTESIRDFLDMEDFLDVVDMILRDSSPPSVFNVSTGIGHSIREIFDLVAAHLGLPTDHPVESLPPGPDDIPEVVLDPTETSRQLGWFPRVSFADSVKKMLQWYDSHGVTAIYSHLRQESNNEHD